MTGSETHGNGGASSAVHRVDRFVVPRRARAEFLERVRATHDVLRTQPGFVRDVVLERSSGPDESVVVTHVEWADARHVEGARAAVSALHRESGFDPEKLFERLGIQADCGMFTQVEW